MWFASQIQRFTLAAYVGASSLMLDLGITAAAAGFLASVYFPVYGSMQVPSGVLADLGDPRRNLLIGGSLMVVSGLAFACVPSYEAAVAARVAIGLSAGLLWLSSIKICSLLPGRAYGARLSVLIAIGAVGSVVGLAGLPALLSISTWRVVAALVALPTLVVTLLLLLVEVPRAKPSGSAGELWRRCLGSLGRMGEVIRRLAFWRVVLPNMFWTGSSFALLTWLPRYARDALGMAPAAVGVLPALSPLGQVLGSAFLGYVQARRPGWSLPIFFATCGAYVAGLTLLASGLPASVGPFALYPLTLGLGLLYGSFFLSLAWIADVVEPELLGTASGVVNGLGFLPAFVLPWVMGGLMDAVDHPTSPDWRYSTDAYQLAFSLTAVALAAALVTAGLISARTRGYRRRPAAPQPD